MADISKSQIKSIYTLGGALGLVDHTHSHDDNLHQLVGAITGKESVKALTGDEANKVISELMRRMRGFPDTPAPRRTAKKHEETPGGLTGGQKRKVWVLMYALRDLDSVPSDASLGSRLCGIIRRQFRVDAAPKDPFRFLTWEQGRQLIEILKKYCGSAEARRIRAGEAR